MKLVILEDYDKASEWAAKYVRNSILKFNPGPGKFFVLGLPTGIAANLQCAVGFAIFVRRFREGHTNRPSQLS